MVGGTGGVVAVSFYCCYCLCLEATEVEAKAEATAAIKLAVVVVLRVELGNVVVVEVVGSWLLLRLLAVGCC